MGVENFLLDGGSKAVREEEDGIGSGSQGSTDFFARAVFIMYKYGFFDVPRFF
jgi:hypothetical protein